MRKKILLHGIFKNIIILKIKKTVISGLKQTKHNKKTPKKQQLFNCSIVPRPELYLRTLKWEKNNYKQANHTIIKKDNIT